MSLIAVPGVRAVATVLAYAPERIEKVFVHGRPAGRRAELVAALEAAQKAVKPASRARLDGLADAAVHQGIIAMCAPADYVDLPTLFRDPSLLLALDEVTDPRNFGAMLRSLEAFGGSGAIITRRRSARLGPTVTKTSAGASEILPVAMVTNLGRALDEARRQRIQVVAADFGGVRPRAIDWSRPTILVVGAEGAGVRPSIRERADVIASIAMSGRTASLNAAVATSVLLHCAHEARNPPQPLDSQAD